MKEESLEELEKLKKDRDQKIGLCPGTPYQKRVNKIKQENANKHSPTEADQKMVRIINIMSPSKHTTTILQTDGNTLTFPISLTHMT